MTITHELLDEIERGLEGVTPGPWHVEEMYAAAPVICDERSSAFACALPKQIAAHMARLDPQTVGELVRLARIGLEAGDHDLAAAAYLHGAADLKDAIARAEAAEATLKEALQRIDMLTAALKMSDAARRQWALADLVATRGYFNRSDLTREFGISEAQAAVDIRRFLQSLPKVATYNTSTKRYERAPIPQAPGVGQ